MVAGILMLAVVIFGVCVLFGLGNREDFYKFLIWLIVAPILLSIGFNHAVWFWSDLPLVARIGFLLASPFVVSALLPAFFPGARWIVIIQGVLFESLVSIFLFPFRFLWRAGGIFLDRERRAPGLDQYRPVVGGRPPLEDRSAR